MRESIGIAIMLLGCASVYAKPTAYTTELTVCSEKSATLCESIACENRTRAAYDRPPRSVPAHCRDAGAP